MTPNTTGAPSPQEGNALLHAVGAILDEYIDEPAVGAPPEVHHIANSGWKNVVPKWLALREAYLRVAGQSPTAHPEGKP